MHKIWKKHFQPSIHYDSLNKRFLKEKDAGLPGVRNYGVKLTKPRPEQFKRKMRPFRVVLPSKVDYRPILEAGGFKVFDQGSQGSCTANAGCADKAFQEILSDTYPGSFARAMLYYLCRKLHGWENEDSGAYMEDIGVILAENGVCLDSTMPYNQFDYTTPPSQEALGEGLEWTTNRDQTRLRWSELKAALVDGPVLIDGAPVGLPRIGVPIYSSFTQSEYNGGWVPVPKANEELLGGHALLVVGYDDYLTGPDGNVGYYIVLNSWGTLQGAKGYQYFPYDYEKLIGPQSDNWQQFDETPGPRPGPNPPEPTDCYSQDLECQQNAMTKTDFWAMFWAKLGCMEAFFICYLGLAEVRRRINKALGKKLTMTKKTSLKKIGINISVTISKPKTARW